LLDSERRDADRRERPGSAKGAKLARGRRKGGESFVCELHVVPLPEDQDIEGGEIVVFRDLGDSIDEVEARERYQSALHTAREEERRRMATDLHDGVGQVLARLRRDLKALRAEVPNGQAAGSKLDELAAIIDDTVGDVRHMANQLRPDVLDKQGLVPALQWLCGEFDRRSGIACAFTADAGEITVGPERAVLVYRVVEEALTNVSRHAPGSTASVAVASRGDVLRFEVTDDGPGFELGAVRADALGLGGMRERATLLGGRLGVVTREGRGTTVRLEISAE
jgi:signal transduction histidine kinase